MQFGKKALFLLLPIILFYVKKAVKKIELQIFENKLKIISKLISFFLYDILFPN